MKQFKVYYQRFDISISIKMADSNDALDPNKFQSASIIHNQCPLRIAHVVGDGVLFDSYYILNDVADIDQFHGITS